MSNKVLGFKTSPEELLWNVRESIKLYYGKYYSVCDLNTPPPIYYNSQYTQPGVPKEIQEYIDSRILIAIQELLKNLYTEEDMEKDFGLR